MSLKKIRLLVADNGGTPEIVLKIFTAGPSILGVREGLRQTVGGQGVSVCDTDFAGDDLPCTEQVNSLRALTTAARRPSEWISANLSARTDSQLDTFAHVLLRTGLNCYEKAI